MRMPSSDFAPCQLALLTTAHYYFTHLPIVATHIPTTRTFHLLRLLSTPTTLLYAIPATPKAHIVCEPIWPQQAHAHAHAHVHVVEPIDAGPVPHLLSSRSRPLSTCTGIRLRQPGRTGRAWRQSRGRPDDRPHQRTPWAAQRSLRTPTEACGKAQGE